MGPRLSAAETGESKDSLYLIREEIAIMKKLNHPNLVQLIEVLDDPEEDSLYMVLEMCKKGVIMKVGLHEPADPYHEESCRFWFRDLILGIEYRKSGPRRLLLSELRCLHTFPPAVHAQGVVHRDIKPDNLLLTEDDVLKVVDFGVSEMFEKVEDMRTSKSAGSPAFLPPELCRETRRCLRPSRRHLVHGCFSLLSALRQDTFRTDRGAGDVRSHQDRDAQTPTGRRSRLCGLDAAHHGKESGEEDKDGAA